MRVELYYAPLPFIGAIASHYWFVVHDERDGCHRWEVWQTPDAGGRSYGHVHCDLKTPHESVGGGPSRLAETWTGEEAERIAAVLAKPQTYPHCRRYHYWPGPNSNSFVAWVLREAGIPYRLPWRAIGKSCLR